jgi:hypothetical protein
MEIDYPASHSMDTCWFAVDAAGHVAYFSSGETGTVPNGDENDLRDELYQLWFPPAEDAAAVDALTACEARGVYSFSYRENYDADRPVECYHRRHVPEVPVHIDQLPPGMREMFAQRHLPVRFDQVEQVQPLEHLRCGVAGDYAAYLACDGKTVRPIPGEEEDFAEWVQWFREHAPEEAARLNFDGPTEESQP